jgi:glycosyltransferase involved in cell wall biosynthesis
MIPMSVKRSDVAIAISQSVKEDIVRILGVQPEKVKVIYLGKHERFRPIRDPERLSRFRTKYGLSRRVVLFVGLIEPRKNLATLVQAFASLKSLHGDFCLVLAGDYGWGCQDVLASVRRYGIENHVLFPGFIPDGELPELYNLADVFVYPSLYEGFGLPVLEAMACGVPVVTSNVSSMPEVVGEAGLLVDPRSVEELAQGIRRVLTDATLRSQMREKGLERSELFSWEKTARETLEVYRQIAGRRFAVPSGGRIHEGRSTP